MKTFWERRAFPRIDRLSSVVEEGSVLFISRCVGPYAASAQGTPIRLSIVVYAHTILIQNHPLMSRSVGFIGSAIFGGLWIWAWDLYEAGFFGDFGFGCRGWRFFLACSHVDTSCDCLCFFLRLLAWLFFIDFVFEYVLWIGGCGAIS